MMNYTENIDVNKYIDQRLKKTSEAQAPKVIFLAGQSGAGKGKVRDAVLEQLKQNAVVVDPDVMRGFHPDQETLMRADDKTASTHTHELACKYADALRDAAIEGKRNIVFDGTLGSQKKAENLCKMMQSHGYQIEVHALAVNELESRLGIVDRYEKQKAKDGYGRWVPPEVHDATYNGMPKSVALIEENKLANAIYVHNRAGENLYENKLDENGQYSQLTPHAQEEINAQRAKPWSLETQNGLKESIRENFSRIEKRGASQSDKGNLAHIESSINTKIIRDEMRLISQNAQERIQASLKSKQQSQLIQDKSSKKDFGM